MCYNYRIDSLSASLSILNVSIMDLFFDQTKPNQTSAKLSWANSFITTMLAMLIASIQVQATNESKTFAANSSELGSSFVQDPRTFILPYHLQVSSFILCY